MVIRPAERGQPAADWSGYRQGGGVQAVRLLAYINSRKPRPPPPLPRKCPRQRGFFWRSQRGEKATTLGSSCSKALWCLRPSPHSPETPLPNGLLIVYSHPKVSFYLAIGSNHNALDLPDNPRHSSTVCVEIFSPQPSLGVS